MTDIVVACVGADGSWACSVRVVDEASSSDHVVTVDEIDLPPSLDGAETADVERLVVATFEFLLEREPKESILSRFEPRPSSNATSRTTRPRSAVGAAHAA